MNTKVKDITLGALFIAMISIFAQLKINISGLVPITLQTLAVYLIGSVLKPKQAFLCMIGYLLLGAIGIPVFSNFGSGLGSLLGPTGGYIMIFPFMALLISVLTKKEVPVIFSYLLATVLCYSVGTGWFMYYTGQTLQASLGLCVYPFLIGDTLKIAISSALSPKIKRICK